MIWLQQKACAGVLYQIRIFLALIASMVVTREVLQETLRPIREKREMLARDTASIMEMLHTGTNKARAVAAETLAEVKRAMKLDYFN